ncbi:ankyrin repeat-containing domain protein [Trichophaea hybrida]|nr:ankyrin repeat-containing domain protein [Trichophaea hybrida]
MLLCTQDDNHAPRKTPLIISAQKGLIAATQLLLEQNVYKDAQDDTGQTALHHAVENGSEAIVRLLVEQGANKTIRDNCDRAALNLAVKKL